MTKINRSVTVNSFFFRRGEGFTSFPGSIELDNNRYTFKDGFQYLLQSGGRAVRLFDMDGGDTMYRLRLDGDQWTLVGTRPV